ncbi:molybdopterin synthase sulfur carrier subunit [Comamonas odontotermitis]|uniref:Molybdopterin synthase sulfur carrier subunit n=1 Tax=Comamonas odontotermitis TaxID=379895 RepID=A0ABR6RDN9_9BURK|nr:molybdopterin converting factor subunit 1 [Comamonas odontotermitis]MBB6577244.1 molybdopterin synthase sulfur carrier subunit [Comamonas odontotermitis]
MSVKNIQLRYFASIREAIGRGSESMQTDAADVGALRNALLARGEPYATCLARGRAVRIAVNQTMGDEDAMLEDGAEIAFFPPVTGG